MRSSLPNELASGPDSDKKLLGKYPGIVRDSFDPEERGRIRIYCPEVMGEVDSDEHWLGWAEASAPLAGFDQGLLMVPPDPSWESRDSGAGNSPYNETRVWVEFRDGDVRRPIYSLGGTWLGESDLPHSGVKLGDANSGGDETTASPNRISSSTRTDVVDRTTGDTAPGPEVKEPQPATTAQYPFNYVFKTPAGAVVEFDNTPDGERIRLYHPAGTSWEINQSGTLATKISGKESTFVSEDSQRIVKGSSTTICEGLSHRQFNKSSTWVYQDDVVEVIKKSKKSFISSGLEEQIGGLHKSRAGTVEIESVGAIKLVGGSAVNIGTDNYSVTANEIEVSGLTSKFQGQATCIVKCLTGVEIEGTASATHPIYASNDINASWVAESAELSAQTAAIAPTLGAATAPPEPVLNGPALVAWMGFVTAAIVNLSAAFNSSLTIHKASKT